MEQALVAFVEGRVVRYSRAADRRPRDPQGRGARGAVAAQPSRSTRSGSTASRSSPNLWPTSAVIDWYLLLKRQPKLPRRDERMQAAEQMLRSRLNFQGTTMGFSTEKTRRAVVAHGLGRRQRQQAAAGVRTTCRRGRTTCRGSCAARSAACSAGAGTRRSPTPGACWRSASSRRASRPTPVTGTTTATLGERSFAHAWQPDDGHAAVRAEARRGPTARTT